MQGPTRLTDEQRAYLHRLSAEATADEACKESLCERRMLLLTEFLELEAQAIAAGLPAFLPTIVGALSDVERGRS